MIISIRQSTHTNTCDTESGQHRGAAIVFYTVDFRNFSVFFWAETLAH